MGGPDSSFSMEPHEFRQMVQAIRNVEKALGKVTYELSPKSKNSKQFCRSLFAIRDIKLGEQFTQENVRSIRPGYGLSPKYLDEILGKKARIGLEKGMPLKWEQIN